MSVKPSLIILGIVLSVFLFSGCATHEITAESPEPESGEDNAWYKPVVDEAEYFIGLNLDGAGDHDDQAVVTTYRWEGSLEDCYTLLSIRLGTGKVLSRGFRGWMDFTFQTGHLREGVHRFGDFLEGQQLLCGNRVCSGNWRG